MKITKTPIVKWTNLKLASRKRQEYCHLSSLLYSIVKNVEMHYVNSVPHDVIMMFDYLFDVAGGIALLFLC